MKVESSSITIQRIHRIWIGKELRKKWFEDIGEIYRDETVVMNEDSSGRHVPYMGVHVWLITSRQTVPDLDDGGLFFSVQTR